MSETSLGVILLTPLLAYPYFKLDFEQDATQKALSIKQKTK